MAEKIVIFQADIDIDLALKESANLQSSINKLSDELKNMKGTEKELSEEYVAKQIHLRDLKREYSELNKNIDKVVDSQKNEIKSIDALNKRNALLRAELKNIDLSKKEGLARAKQINDEINKNTAFIKENSDALVQNKMNVGNYTESIVNAANQLNIAGESTQKFGGIMQGINLIIKANPIGLLITAFQTLMLYFTQTSTGAKQFRIIMSAVGAVFDTLIGTVSKLGQGIFTLISDPKKGFSALGESIKENIINRKNAVSEFIESIKNADGEKLVNSFIKLNTGIDNAIGKAKNFTNQIKENANSAIVIEELRQRFESLNRENSITLTKLEAQRDLLNEIADDDTKGWKERNSASLQGQKLIEQIASLEVETAKNRLNGIQSEIKLKRQNNQVTSELLDDEADAQRQLIEAENKRTQALYDNAMKRRQAKRDEFEQDLDFLIDGLAKNKEIELKKLDDTTKSIEERQNILTNFSEKSKKTIQDELDLYEKYANKRIDLDGLIAISNEKLRNEKIKELNLNEIENNRLKEIINERISLTLELTDAQKKLTDEAIKQNEKRLFDSFALDEKQMNLWNERDKANYENRLILAKENIDLFSELELQAIEERYNQEILRAKETYADLTLIDKKFAKQRAAIENEAQKQKLNAIQNVADNIAQAFGDTTEAGRAAALISLGISTIQKSQEAFATASAAFPPPFGQILGAASAAAIIAGGLKAAQQITSAKNDLPTSGAYGAGVGLGGISTGNQTVASTNITPQIGQGIVSRQTVVNQQPNISLQPTLVIDDVTSKQSQTSNNNKTGTL